jgi:magnesium transporter
MVDVLTRTYRHGEVVADGFPLQDVSEQLDAPDTTVWVDLCAPSREDLDELAAELGLHALAVENALQPQRPKLDRYATHQFLSCRTVRVDAEAGTLDETEVDAFIGPRWLVTVRQSPAFRIEPVLMRWDQSPDLAVHGVGFLLYGLLDAVVEGYFDVVQAFDDYYDSVSEGIFAEKPLDLPQQRHWLDMRRAMFRAYRLAVPMRELCASLVRREHTAIAAELLPYFQDVYDHVSDAVEEMDSLRAVVSTILETNLGLREYRQNLIAKKVSGWAAIIAVPTLITGYFGMNVPYPGFQQAVGVVVSAGLMVLGSILLYVLFRRSQWL